MRGRLRMRRRRIADATTQPRYGSGVRWPTKAMPRRSTHSGSCTTAAKVCRKITLRAAKWWRLAADQGHTFAQYNLGTLYDNGKGVPQNKAEALKWYHLAAERGNDGAQFNVGVLHFAGVAVSENRIEAAKWFRRAADQGHIGAQVYLGLCYATGLGVPQDNIQAYMWLSLAAARGDQDAISNRNRVAQQMTPAQIAEAQKLAVEWKSKPER